MKSITIETQGIVRAEIRLARPKTIRGYADAAGVLRQIDELSKNCHDIFMDVFAKVVPFEDYYKKDRAAEIIRKSVNNSIMRRKMVHLLALIP